MKTLFTVLLIICAIIYAYKPIMWVWYTTRKDLDSMLSSINQSKIGWYFAMLEHVIFMVTLVGASILLNN